MRQIGWPIVVYWLLVTSQAVVAQTAGDYRSAGSGSWSGIAWERYNGTAWVTTFVAPDSAVGQINIVDGDTVTVTVPTHADQLVVDAGGTIVVDLNSALTLANGAGDDMIVYGGVRILNGSLGSPGSILIGPGGTLTFAEPVGSSIGGVLTNNGTIEWLSGNIGFGANVNIVNNGTFNIRGNNTLQNGLSFPGGLINNGTINKISSGTTSLTISNGFFNNGTLHLLAGTVSSLYDVTNTGSFQFNSGSFIHQSDFYFNGGSLNGSGLFTNSGVLHLQADLEFPVTLIFSMEATTTTTGPGNLVLNQDFVIDGNFTGSGTLTIHGNTLWNSRRIGRPFTNEAGRTLTLATTAGKIIAAPITNNGTMVWQEGDILFYANTVFTNNGNLTISGNNEMRNGDSFGACTNTGTITKTSTGITVFNLFTGFNNSGTINLDAGTISTVYTVTNTGNFIFNAGSFVHEGTFDHHGGTMSGTGHFTNAGWLDLQVDLEFPSTLMFSMDATTTTTGPGDLILNQDFIIEGNFTGAGALIIHGNTLWNSRRIGRRFTNEAGRTCTLATPEAKIIAASIVNNGIMDWQDGNILFYANTDLTNNGTLTISGNNEIRNGDSWGNVTNNGTVRKTSAGITTFALTFITNNSTGVIQGTGTITINAPSVFVYTNTGTFAPGLSAGVLALQSHQPFSNASTLAIEMQNNSGAGTGHDQLTRDGNLTLAGTLSVTETGTVSNGTFTIIQLSSGTISGAFDHVQLPAGYNLVINTSNVQLVKNAVVTPVHFMSFTAIQKNRHVLLGWVTENEVNNQYFEVERSADGLHFTSIGRVMALAGLTGRKEYSFIDAQPLNGINYYRLRQVDKDGRYAYSLVVSITIDGQQGFITLYPNPVKNILQIRFNNTNQATMIAISDIQGRQVMNRRVNNLSTVQLPVQHLPPGIYYLQVTGGVNRIVIPFIKE
jgi:hypothetical protein